MDEFPPEGAPGDDVTREHDAPVTNAAEHPSENGAARSDGDGRSLRDRLILLGESTDGSAGNDGLGLAEPVDRVEAFSPGIIAIRWGTTIASVALAVDHYDGRASVVIFAVAIVAYTVLRTFQPIRYLGTVRSMVEVIAEVALGVAAVCCTGRLGVAVHLLADDGGHRGRVRPGFAFALRLALVSSAAVTITYLGHQVNDERIQLSIEWSLVVILVAVVAGYARRISGEADRQHSLALDRLGRLTDANALLFSLHRVTQTLPASLDLDDVLDTTITRLRGLFEFDSAAIMVLDDTDAGWQVVRRENMRLPSQLKHGRAAAAAAVGAGRQQRAQRPGSGHRGRSRAEPQGQLRALRGAGRPGRGHRPGGGGAPVSPSLLQPGRGAAPGFRGAGGAGHRQRPLVRAVAHRGRRRGTNAHRP